MSNGGGRLRESTKGVARALPATQYSISNKEYPTEQGKRGTLPWFLSHVAQSHETQPLSASALRARDQSRLSRCRDRQARPTATKRMPFW